ncbi:hypothetical protein [Fusobacterium polymorphum]|jgi:hypothetical protein|uniref:hypothetical protein n=1 Tax=Fusobacterium nucleatum subsp. polymorphum TaxID=76857 RepID=UPI0030CF87D8
MNDLSNLPVLADMSKTLFEYIKAVNSNEVVTFVGIAMGITGYSLRDFVGKIQISNLIDKMKNHFKEKEKITEKQEKILRDCFLELEDYIKTCEELDENVFEHISDVLINGIDNEDILTREYIKILKKLSWFDLIVLKEVYKKNNDSNFETIKGPADLGFDYNKIPYELVMMSLEKLEKIGIIHLKKSLNEGLAPTIYCNNTLGTNIVSLINEKS